jgi:hypothetical protein
MDTPHANLSPASWRTARPSFWHIARWNRLKNGRVTVKSRVFSRLEGPVNNWMDAARQFIPGQFECSTPVILTYRTLKSVKKWLSYAAENRFYPLTCGRRPDVNLQPSVKQRKTSSIPESGLKMACVDFAVECTKNLRERTWKKFKMKKQSHCYTAFAASFRQ